MIKCRKLQKTVLFTTRLLQRKHPSNPLKMVITTKTTETTEKNTYICTELISNIYKQCVFHTHVCMYMYINICSNVVVIASNPCE